MKTVRALLLAAVFCVTALHANAADPPPHVDTWVPKPEVVNLVVEGTNKNLDTAEMLRIIRQKYARWRITFKLRHEVTGRPVHPAHCKSPRGETCYHLYSRMSVFVPGMGYTYGKVADIDEGNRVDERLCSHVVGGAYVGSIYHGILRAHRTVEGFEVSTKLLTKATAMVVTHEVGHMLGLWHPHTYRPYIMAIGTSAEPWKREHFGPGSILLLDRTLGRRNPEPKKAEPQTPARVVDRRTLRVPGR
jgi:hypothetical protein